MGFTNVRDFEATRSMRVRDLRIPDTSRRITFVSDEDFPEGLKLTSGKDVLYISGDVHAMTSRGFLRENADSKFGELYGREGFYKMRPENYDPASM